MPTATSSILVCVMMLLAPELCAQIKDTTDTNLFERFWTKPRLIPKFGVGVQGSAFLEAGIQLHKIYVHPLTLASAGPYITCDVVVTDNDIILGPKAGYEVTAGLFGIAADVGYYSNSDIESVLFTPKLGVTILGFADLFYGRSFTLSNDSFPAISVSRFSLIINLNPDYFDLRDARRRKK
jgi:hypothetical protein